MASVTSHEKLGDGSYQLVVLDDHGDEHAFAWGPHDPETRVHEGGRKMTEKAYIEMQRREAVALVDAHTATAETTSLL